MVVRFYLIQLLCAAALALPACTQYAVVYVNAVEDNSGSKTARAAEVYSGKSGLYLGETPFYMYFQKSCWERKPTLSLIVKDPDFAEAWQYVEVERFAPTKSDAFDAVYQNAVRFELKEVPPTKP